MNPRILDVKYIAQYRLALTFIIGEKADVDMQERIVGRGGIFKSLEHIDFFKQVSVDEEIRYTSPAKRDKFPSRYSL